MAGLGSVCVVDIHSHNHQGIPEEVTEERNRGGSVENWDLVCCLKPTYLQHHERGIPEGLSVYTSIVHQYVSFCNWEKPLKQTGRMLPLTSIYREKNHGCLVRDVSCSRSYSYYMMELEIKPRYSGSKTWAFLSESVNSHYEQLSLLPTPLLTQKPSRLI